MDSVQERICKLREERIAREKARIEKLRQLNLQKYNKNDSNSNWNQSKTPSTSNVSSLHTMNVSKCNTTTVKNNFHMNTAYKRPASAPASKTTIHSATMSKVKQPNGQVEAKVKASSSHQDIKKPVENEKVQGDVKKDLTKKTTTGQDVKAMKNNNEVSKVRHMSLAAQSSTQSMPSTSSAVAFKSCMSRKSYVPTKQSSKDASSKRVSVFERLYQPKAVPKATANESQKLTDTKHTKKVVGSVTINERRKTISYIKPSAPPVRRSISAVHLKRTNKSELSKCIHNWASVGEKLNEVKINEVDEDESIGYEKIVSAVKSERKKVKFLTPISMRYNTPKPEELQERLNNWLQKRGKSLNSYHHLQCFGIAHLSNNLTSIETSKLEVYDEENKENIALDSDSDDKSFTENLNDRKDDFVIESNKEFRGDKWRRASYSSDNTSMNDSKDITLTPSCKINQADELLLGALNDLTELLREGFDWAQCARWLRAIRHRFPSAPESAAYWECRAALEERRGDLPASMQCWEEAIAMGTEHKVVEENLDQLLDKFMQLKISPSSGREKQMDQKMVDVKNVLKSTIIRFAVHKAKMRQSNQHEAESYTVTPVRRSARLSTHGSAKRTPLQVCSTISQATSLGHRVVFVPNDSLFGTP
ncbi:uncharacterized protein [Battus philenor]|uniref:uncharacterized protein n=1 Tax=Battus philenor TaxID=42288 RepID=UPI0035D06155